METTLQQCSRLLAALEDLVAQESALIGSENLDELTSVQDRAALLVERLVALAPLADSATRQRALVLVAHRQANEARLAEQVQRAEDELRLSRESRSRLTHVAPAYRVAPPSMVRRLRATG